ncbi:BCCT family transporter [Auritidibacter ignavus]|uniref:BCCT family transporter n=1 Tax=Auritidibacter TaxID=1160973 RepID=UPI000D729A81|nr:MULTISPECIES: BCCT family transporter [Auritidibacter]PXA75702.1 multidrug DMT transporter permease [Auritidibacter sp. NML120779]PXA79785.1 multidrug DMT transporter permease [Auritidibacter sp. NML120636]WGH80699.1 BCCT family transporter [Auritidibacter ignavus]WGH85968.1 BCCT family transporter [Auritidibacter ignavus]WGH88254.1 BCCT family transporter [Auritidibacter ignavus]
MLTKLHDALKLKTSPVIFFSSAGIIILFVIATIAFTEPLGGAVSTASDWLLTNLGWFYVLGVTVFLGFLIYIALGRFGRVKLGPNDEKPEHSGLAWFAMLFAAGIGSILMFWGVAEPVSHFGDPPRGPSLGIEAGTDEAAAEAMNFTFYHFTLHTWTIFTLPALCFAYFIHKRNLPPRVSSIFQPILGERIHGPIGKFIDVVAIVGTVFGVAVSIGLGTLQINGGLGQLFGVPNSAGWQLIIIGVVTGVALLSVSLGLDKGIKVLSNINIVMAIGLLIFVLITGSTLFMLRGTFESLGSYLHHLPEMALWNDTFADTGWQNTWTVFYWAWTITWSPFVGIFIARISKGRTVRQFVLGVLAIPSAFSILWFGIFGYGSFDIELNGDGGLVERVVDEGDIPGALFAFLEHHPWSYPMSILAIILVVIFFITSVDSAALVTDTMTNGHEDYNPLGQRIFWAVAIGLITATLLVFSAEGGLTALEQTIILVGLPFFVMGYFQMYALYRALREDAGELPQIRTREWKKVLPPEEYARRDADDDFNTDDVVVEPEAEEPAPVMRDPYLDLETIEPRAKHGTLAARTSSAPLPKVSRKDRNQ